MPNIELRACRLPTDHDLAFQIIQDALDSVMTTFRRLQLLKALDGVLLEKKAIAATPTRLVHSLNRKPLGWILARQNTNTTVWEISSDTTSITLQAGGACTVNVLVY